MNERRGLGPGAARTVPGWIKLLVGFHVVAATVWALPQPPIAVAQGKVQPSGTLWLLLWNAKYLKTYDPIRGYVMATGVWQYWDMFAPDPSGTDWYCTADVTYRDGTTRTIPYPRISRLPISQKYVKERYRKFFERAHDSPGREPRLWPLFAQAMALRAYTDPKNPPLVVRLRQHSLNIAPPGGVQGTEYTAFEYYAYAVDQARLRQAAGTR